MDTETKRIGWDEIAEEDLGNGITRKAIYGTNLTIAQIRLKAGSVVSAHKHHNEQISSVIQGSILVETGKQEITVSEGQILVIPPNQIHKVTALKDSLVLDTFSPPRKDWLEGDDAYLRKK